MGKGHDSKPGVRPLLPSDEVELTAKLSSHRTHSHTTVISSVRSNSVTMPDLVSLHRVSTLEKALTDTSHFIPPVSENDEDINADKEVQTDVMTATDADIKDAEIFRRQTIIRKGIKDFKFGDMLGDGSYSQVFLATSKTDSSKTYAVKVLNKEYLIKQKKVKYVNIEKTALQNLKSVTGVINLSFTFQDEANLYFLLEYAPNGDFLSLIKKFGTLNEECTIYYSAQIIDAIGSMHSHGIIHRDIKPENILLDGNMKIKLTDFGTAKLLQKKSDKNGKPHYNLLTRSSSFVGTAEYVSPELLSDNYTDYKCDIWAFGCLVYQMIAGKPPFKATNEYLTFQKVMKVQFAFTAGFPTIIRDLVKNILVKQPEKRLTIPQIKEHCLFENINFSDNSVWSRDPPKILPYRINAKSMQPFSPPIPQSPFQKSKDDKHIIVGKNIKYIRKRTNLPNSISSPNLDTKSAPNSPTVSQPRNMHRNIDIAIPSQNFKSSAQGLALSSKGSNFIKDTQTKKQEGADNNKETKLTTSNTTKLSRSQSQKIDLHSKIYAKKKSSGNSKAHELHVITREIPMKKNIDSPRPYSADSYTPKNNYEKSRNSGAPDLPERIYKFDKAESSPYNSDSDTPTDRNMIKRRFSKILLTDFMDIQKEHVLNNIIGDIIVVDTNIFEDKKQHLYNCILNESFRNATITKQDTVFKSTRENYPHKEEDYYYKSDIPFKTVSGIKELDISEEVISMKSVGDETAAGLYFSPCAFVVTTFGRALMIMETCDKLNFKRIFSVNLFCSGTSICMNEVGIISIVNPFKTFILRCSKNDVLIVLSAIKRSIKLNPDSAPPPSIPESPKGANIGKNSAVFDAVQAARLANPILSREKYHRPTSTYHKRKAQNNTDKNNNRIFNSFVNAKASSKKSVLPVPNSRNLVNGLPSNKEPQTHMVGLGLSQRMRRSGDRTRNETFQQKFNSKNESFLRQR
ncbi:Serine/Threonine protein kinases active-site signature [Nakaseomyces glabratus]|nr:Serine/Threonine protein kinases active-site signature [Nakaseomyces glabratus]